MNNRQTYDGMCFRKGNDNRSLIMKNVQNMKNMQNMQIMKIMQNMQKMQNPTGTGCARTKRIFYCETDRK